MEDGKQVAGLSHWRPFPSETSLERNQLQHFPPWRNCASSSNPHNSRDADNPTKPPPAPRSSEWPHWSLVTTCGQGARGRLHWDATCNAEESKFSQVSRALSPDAGKQMLVGRNPLPRSVVPSGNLRAREDGEASRRFLPKCRGREQQATKQRQGSS